MYSNNKHSSYYGDEIVHTFPEYPFDYQYLINRLKSYRNPRNKIGLMIKKGQIIRIKKGIYILSSNYGGEIDKFTIANLIYGPSYVSFETALSYWGLIPERVNLIISTTTKRNKKLKTPLGTFLYHYLNNSRYIYGVTRVVVKNNSAFLIAKREKALCDVIATSHIYSIKDIESYLIENMRIDLDLVQDLDRNLLKILSENYSNVSVRLFCKWYSKYFKLSEENYS